MAGEGMERTYVVADAQGPMDESATLITQGDNIIFKGISFTVRNPSNHKTCVCVCCYTRHDSS